MQSDGTLVQIKPDGTKEQMVVHPPTPLSDEAITAAALRDPDAQPLTEADLARMYPPATMERLVAIKRTYDPGNLFNQNYNIKP